jgi:hypothetical protein
MQSRALGSIACFCSNACRCLLESGTRQTKDNHEERDT